MLTLGDRGANRWQTGLDSGHPRRRAGDVELFADSSIAPHLRQMQRLALIGQTSICDGQALLQSAQLEVISPYFRSDDDPYILERCFEALGIRARGTSLRAH